MLSSPISGRQTYESLPRLQPWLVPSVHDFSTPVCCDSMYRCEAVCMSSH